MYSLNKGIILNSYNYSDADKIFKIFTEELGIITVLGKGVRKINSKRGGLLDTLNFISFKAYQKKDFYYLTELKTLNNFKKIKSNLALSSWSFFILEVTSLLVPEHQKSPYIFSKLKDTLLSLEKKPNKRTIYKFLYFLIENEGYWSNTYYLTNPYLKKIFSNSKVSPKEQKDIDLFFITKIKEIAEKDLNSLLLLKSI
ncbi:MAG TPA: DNA repair protein RecO [candidate division WWE3 bacterium]|uniref:DNA repair protein RecO n=1 Tax=candidate division WWE3 bacterium TaxID=2053526 RepID=A0A7V5J1I0_UNCKA|nr:DNA repair protein RecO [candidate division WWE3 bacterium]